VWVGRNVRDVCTDRTTKGTSVSTEVPHLILNSGVELPALDSTIVGIA
jgi:hypothetical protein